MTLDDTAVLQHASDLSFEFVQTAVASIPDRPVTSSFLVAEPAPAPLAEAAAVEQMLRELAIVWVFKVSPCSCQ